MKLFALATIALVLASGMNGQTATAPITATGPAITLPTAFSITGEFNQLSTPQWALGLTALYTTNAQGGIGMYNTTTADVVPLQKTDPTTGKKFYALNASIRQGVHEKVISFGRFTGLIGLDVGPGFSQATGGGISVSATGSFTATALVRINDYMSAVFPLQLLYINGAGFNPVLAGGLSFNLKKLSAK